MSVVVAIAATFLSICNVKDSNIVQAMQQSQADVVNRWAYFQAKSTKQQVASAAADEISALRSTVTDAAALERLDALVAQWREDAARYEVEKKQIETDAHAAEQAYAALNLRDDQFDLSEASLSLSIALMGITALTRQRWLLVLGVVFAGFGIFMAACGFASLPIHPDALTSLLT